MSWRVKHLPAVWEMRVWSLGREDPLEKEMATHSSILAWRIPWMEEPGSSLKQCSFIISRFLWVRSPCRWLCPLLMVSWVHSQGASWATLSSGAWMRKNPLSNSSRIHFLVCDGASSRLLAGGCPLTHYFLTQPAVLCSRTLSRDWSHLGCLAV